MTVCPAPRSTALAAALIRAYHQVADEPRVFDDPLAVPIGGIDPTMLHQLCDDQPDAKQRRLFINARSRYAEEIVAAAEASGCLQIVVLQAGLDTFAYRAADSGLRVFELDAAEALAWKKQRLAAAHIEVPDRVSFAAVDLNADDLAAALATAGFDRARPACFVWLGSVMYLPAPAVRNVLRYIAALPAPPQVVFDYLAHRKPRGAWDAAVRRPRFEVVANLGEPWTTVFAADMLDDELRVAGFDEIEHFASSELVARYVDEPVADPDPVDRRLVRAARFG